MDLKIVNFKKRRFLRLFDILRPSSPLKILLIDGSSLFEKHGDICREYAKAGVCIWTNLIAVRKWQIWNIMNSRHAASKGEGFPLSTAEYQCSASCVQFEVLSLESWLVAMLWNAHCHFFFQVHYGQLVSGSSFQL